MGRVLPVMPHDVPALCSGLLVDLGSKYYRSILPCVVLVSFYCTKRLCERQGISYAQ